jgi:precorrin-2 methylase
MLSTEKMNGKVYLIGIGPGSQDNITPRAASALKNVSVIRPVWIWHGNSLLARR